MGNIMGQFNRRGGTFDEQGKPGSEYTLGDAEMGNALNAANAYLSAVEAHFGPKSSLRQEERLRIAKELKPFFERYMYLSKLGRQEKLHDAWAKDFEERLGRLGMTVEEVSADESAEEVEELAA